MPDPLTPQQAHELGRLMRQLHDRRRLAHGRSRESSAWTFYDDDFLETFLEDLARLRARSSLAEPDVLSSHRPVIGRPIQAVRTMVWRVLKAVFDRQSDVNRDTLRAIETLATEHIKLVRIADALAARISELERSGAGTPGR